MMSTAERTITSSIKVLYSAVVLSKEPLRIGIVTPNGRKANNHSVEVIKGSKNLRKGPSLTFTLNIMLDERLMIIPTAIK